MDPQTRPRIVTLGDLVVDIVASATGPLAHGSDRSARIRFRQGGSAANTARWVAASGGDAVFIGSVGRDDWGRRLMATLEDAGVRTHLVVQRAPTARIVALVEPGGERTFVTDRGAADQLMASDLRPAWFAGAAALHLPGYSLYNEPLASAAGRAAELARAAGASISVDLASRQPILDLGPAEAWSRVESLAPDLLFGNESEAEAALDGRPEHDLLQLAPIVVVKRGDAGCRILARAGRGAPHLVVDVPTKPLLAADTTGAGDAFAAGFLVRWWSSGHGTTITAVRLSRAARAGQHAAARLLTRPPTSAID